MELAISFLCGPTTQTQYMYVGGTSQDVKRLKKKRFFLPSIFLVFQTIYTFLDLMKMTICFKHLEASYILSCDTKAQLFQFRRLKKISTKKSRKFKFNCCVNAKKNHIFAYCDLPLPTGSGEIFKRLQMRFNNPQYEHKEWQNFPNFW